MAPQAMNGASQIAWATNVDRDDPFMSRRMASHAASGVPMMADFGREGSPRLLKSGSD